MPSTTKSSKQEMSEVVSDSASESASSSEDEVCDVPCTEAVSAGSLKCSAIEQYSAAPDMPVDAVPDSDLAKNLEKYREFDEKNLGSISTDTLLNVLQARGFYNKNPTLHFGALRLFRDLNFVPGTRNTVFDKGGRPHGRGFGGRGRHGYRGGRSQDCDQNNGDHRDHRDHREQHEHHEHRGHRADQTEYRHANRTEYKANGRGRGRNFKRDFDA